MEQRAQTELDTIALTALSEEISSAIDNGTYQFGTDQAFEPAVPVGTSGDAFDASNNTLTLNITTTPAADGSLSGADDSANKILIILAIVGSVAIVGVVVILILNFVSNNKKDGKADSKEDKPAKKTSKEPEEDQEETDEE